jgi:hypothetical protein
MRQKVFNHREATCAARYRFSARTGDFGSVLVSLKRLAESQIQSAVFNSDSLSRFRRSLLNKCADKTGHESKKCDVEVVE